MSDPFDLSEPAPSTPSPASPFPAREAPYLAPLNAEQRAAVEALDGPVLVLAGAGTGKTRVLVTRLAHILATRRAFPGQILAVTFTNKAAREMLERVAALIGGGAEGLWLGTFHRVCLRILRRHAELVGLRPGFTILDTDDQLRLLKQVLEAENIDDKKSPPRALLAVIQRWKDRGLGPDRVTAAEAGEFAGGRAVALYRRYQERLAALNACDFGDLLLHCLTLFAAHPDVLADYQRRFRYILVDEYQDTNVAQYLWLRLLARGSGNVCCVGDDDQSIYGWRGAEVGNILRFEKDFPGARVIRLERNYRSTPQILAAASGLIAHNEGRLGKTLWTEGADGDPVRVTGVWDGETEARLVAEEVEALQRAGTRLDGIAVLVRAGAQTRAFEERFIACGIPYRVIGGPRFYERAEIRDAVAYLRLVAEAADDLAFERIANVPRRGIGDATLQAVHVLAKAEGTALTTAAAALIGTDELRPRARNALAGLLESLARWRALAGELAPAELARRVIDESGYAGMWRADRAPDAPGRLENLKELVLALAEFESLESFLEHVALVTDHDQTAAGDMVNVMTLHAAKGLEFDAVFLPGWEEGLFPHQRTLDENGAAGLEEERRLAYVGLTRARRRAHVSFAANRRLFNLWQTAIPSRFVDELPGEHVAVDAAPGLHHPGVPAARGGVAEDAWPAPAFPRRLRARRASLAVDAAVSTGEGGGGIARGARVFHQKFGYGRVLAVDGNKLEIAFDKAGTKRVMASFVAPA